MTIRRPRAVTGVRAFLFVALAVAAACVVWLLVACEVSAPWAPQTILPGVIGAVALLALGAGSALSSRFADAAVTSEGLSIRPAVGRSRTVPMTGIDEVVVLRSLLLPTRVAATPPQRVVLRSQGRTVAGFTPHDAELVRQLAVGGLSPEIVATPLTPLQAHRRYPGSVSLAERCAVPAVWAMVLLPLAIAGLVMWDAVVG
ncbi:hypothetical protein F6B41_21190 [Microbacterium lushaniae]|nr:hypothetical protein F6B41_29895 [Microbacterium lushaniae]KAA9151226.1 hypothetical protein F6B41_21190 [Microbacterium lushaniae]